MSPTAYNGGTYYNAPSDNFWSAGGSVVIPPGNNVAGDACVDADSWSAGIGGGPFSISGGHAKSHPTRQCNLEKTLAALYHMKAVNPYARVGKYSVDEAIAYVTGQMVGLEGMQPQPEPKQQAVHTAAASAPPAPAPQFNASSYSSAAECYTDAYRMGVLASNPNACKAFAN